jgi:hypothetical protein
MKEVKKEIFGSRDSWLIEILKNRKISYLKDIWIATCRNSINNDKKTRYAILLEKKEISILKYINSEIPVYYIVVNKDSIYLENLRDNKSATMNYETFIENFTKKLKCEFIKSSSTGSSNSTALSVFFRENMGKGYSLSDIDFYINDSNILIEEKGYVKDGKGYLGQGQCLSFKEFVNDIFINSIFYILLKSNNKFYCKNLNLISCGNIKEIEKWGKMVEFSVDEISEDQLILLIQK